MATEFVPYEKSLTAKALKLRKKSDVTIMPSESLTDQGISEGVMYHVFSFIKARKTARKSVT